MSGLYRLEPRQGQAWALTRPSTVQLYNETGELVIVSALERPNELCLFVTDHVTCSGQPDCKCRMHAARARARLAFRVHATAMLVLLFTAFAGYLWGRTHHWELVAFLLLAALVSPFAWAAERESRALAKRWEAWARERLGR